MITNREDFLMTILHCGSLDLKLIDGVDYDWADIIDTDSTFCFNLNYVMRRVFEFGFTQIEKDVNDRIAELEDEDKYRGLDYDEEQELESLRELDPMDDFDSFHNYLDTHVWCENHKKIYKKYMTVALGDFAEGTGFEIELD